MTPTIYTFDYSTDYSPSAPVVECLISKAGQATPSVSQIALLDTGADVTMLPITTIQAAGAKYVETRQMRGVIGAAISVDLYLVQVQLGEHTIPAIRAVALSTDGEAIIGRDVINHLVLTLNGLAGVTEIPA